MSRREYTTLDEIQFIDGLIGEGWVSNVSQKRILKILRNYSKTALSRSWPPQVDPKAVKSYAELLIGKLSKV